MRYDKNLAVFLGHADWYGFAVGVGYVPTDKAPPEAVKAMEEYNSYGFKKERTYSNAEEWRKTLLAETKTLQSIFAQMRQETNEE